MMFGLLQSLQSCDFNCHGLKCLRFLKENLPRSLLIQLHIHLSERLLSVLNIDLEYLSRDFVGLKHRSNHEYSHCRSRGMKHESHTDGLL